MSTPKFEGGGVVIRVGAFSMERLRAKYDFLKVAGSDKYF
jgi:hypothetical protein